MSIRLKDTIYETSNNSTYSTNSDKVDGYHFTDLCSNCPHHSVSSSDTSCWYKLITIDVIATGWGDLFYEFEITGRSSGSWGRIRIWAITHNLNKLFGVEPKVTYDGTLGGKFKAYRYTVNNVDKFELWMSLGTWETWNFYVRTYEKETSYMALTWNKEKFTAAPTGFTKEITIGKQDIAGSASKLATARTISLTGSVTGSGTFDGSANLSIATTTNHTHNYAGSSSSGGAATSANKLSTARTISLTGAVTGSGSFDGSTNLSISTTVNHTHSYLPLSGGTVTGTLIIKRSPSVIQFLNASGTTFGYLGFSGDSTPCMYKSDGSTVYTLLTSNNYTSWAATKNHTHNYAGSSSAGGAAIRLDSKQIFPFDGTNSTYRKFATLNLTSRYTGYRSNIKVFLNQCTGNQGNSCDVYVRMYQQNAMGGVPAYRLETNCDDRYFKIYGVLNYSSSISTIDLYVYGSGSSYYSISATLISGDDVISIGSSNISKLPSGTLIEPTKMGSVYSAGKLTTARTISLTGAVTGSGTFDGSGNLSIVTTTNHTHSYAGSSSSGGAATSANKLNTNAGSATNPVYFSGGKPVACTYTLGKSVPSNAVFTDTNTWRGITDSYSGTATDTSLSQKGANTLYNALLNGYASTAGSANDAYNLRKRGTISGSTNVNANKYIKFARITVNSGAYDQCGGYMFIYDCEANYFHGILGFYLRASNVITSTSITLKWLTLTNSAYADSISAVKVADSVYDLYFQHKNSWSTIEVQYLSTTHSKIEHSVGSFVDSISAAARSSCSISLSGHTHTKSQITDFSHTHNYAGSSSAGGAATSANKLTTARTISLTGSVTGSGSFDGSGNLSITTTTNHTHSYAATNHSHDYLPLAGGTMTGGNISWNSDSHGVYFYNGCGIEKWSGYGPSLVAESGTDFHISSKSNRATRYLILHAGNYTSYCAKASHTHDYAPSSHGHSYFSMNSGISLSSIVATADSTYLWNKSSNAFVFTNWNNAISLVVGGTSNDRNAMIQVGHSASNYGQHTGNLYLNKLGGKVYYGTSEVSVVGHTHSYAAASHTHTKSQITDFSHTHNYAGSSSAGGKANDSDKVDGYHIVVGSTGTDASTIYIVT